MSEINPIILTFVGVFVVFVSLIFLAFAIVAISSILSLGNRKKQPINIQQSEVNNSSEEVENRVLSTTDTKMSEDKIIAVLTAAVLASMKNGPECKIRVKSFRRIPQSSPTWNLAGRNDYISEKL